MKCDKCSDKATMLYSVEDWCDDPESPQSEYLCDKHYLEHDDWNKQGSSYFTWYRLSQRTDTENDG